MRWDSIALVRNLYGDAWVHVPGLGWVLPATGIGFGLWLDRWIAKSPLVY
jgi:hypothetical protein